MRIVVALLTAVCFIAAAEASATGVATPQSQAASSAPKPSTIDLIKQPSLLSQKPADNCPTTCQRIGRQQFCDGKPWEGICFCLGLRSDAGTPSVRLPLDLKIDRLQRVRGRAVQTPGQA
jgi:hypothetical protein